MSNHKVNATIALLTRNSAKTIEDVLKGIVDQTEKNYEIICIDSSSTDETVEIMKRYKVRVITIDTADFGHGKTRNFAIQQAKGEFVVFLTHDSVPENINWLSEILKPFSNPKIAGVYGQQVPRPNENPLDKHFQMSLYGNMPITWAKNNWKQGDNIFSDANAAVRKDIMKKHPYVDDIVVSEDYEWASRVLHLGYKIQYSTTARVIHSHSYNLRTLFKRNFDVGVSYKQIYTNSEPNHFIRKGIKVYIQETRHLAHANYAYLIPLATIRDIVRLLAVQIGKKEQIFSTNIKRKYLSAQSWYWK